MEDGVVITFVKSSFDKRATYVDLLLYALPISAVVFIVVTLLDRSANLNKQKDKIEIIPAASE